MIFMSITISE